MNDVAPRRENTMGRSILAVVGAYVFIGIFSIVVPMALFVLLAIPIPVVDENGVFEAPVFTTGQTVIFVAADCLVALMAGVLCGRLAPHSRLRHGATLAGLMLLLGGATLLISYGAEPVAYAVLRTVLAPVFALAGAWIATLRGDPPRDEPIAAHSDPPQAPE